MNNQNSPLLEEKSIALCIILSLVTFGIYYIVWLFGIIKKIKLLAGEEPNAAGELLLNLFVPFYMFFWMYTRSKKLSEAGANCGIPLADRSVVNLILMIFGFGVVSVAFIQADLNKAAIAFRAAGAAV